jgi:O-antigen/teichoic acid export membrane protein
MIRVMSVEDWGVWSGFYSLLHILFMLSFFGINRASSTHIAKYNGTSHLKEVIRSSFQIRIIFNSIFTLVLVLFGKVIMEMIGKQEYTEHLYLAMPLIFLFAIQEYIITVFTGLHRNRFMVNQKLVEHITKLVFVVALFAISVSVEYVIIAYTASAIITTIAGFWLVYHNFYKKLEENHNKRFFKSIIRLGLTLVLINVGQSLILDMDTLMIWNMMGDFETAQFSTAKQTLRHLPQITLALSMGVSPIFAKINSENKAELRKKFYYTYKLNLIFFCVLVVLIEILSPILVPLVYGEEYAQSVIIFQILAPYLIFQTAAMFSGVVLDYMGRAKQRVYVVMIAVVLNLGLNWWLIPIYGGVGAAIATIVAYVPYAILNYLEVKKALR